MASWRRKKKLAWGPGFKGALSRAFAGNLGIGLAGTTVESVGGLGDGDAEMDTDTALDCTVRQGLMTSAVREFECNDCG